MDDEEVPQAVELPPASATPQSGGDHAAKVVPVTVVTGFLGAGKTTLVRHVLTGDHGYRIAVILNEYGEDVGIESSFVQESKGLQGRDGEWIELTNGCMCCSVKNDFVQALESLLERRDGFDYILIETTGLANPGPIAAALWTDEEVEARVRLDSVVTVVDALNINRQMHETRCDGAVNEAQLQIAYADLVILNKLDLAEEEAITRAEADIRAINSTVHILRTEHANVDLDLLLNRNGYTHKGEITLPPIAEETSDGELEGGSGPGSSATRTPPGGASGMASEPPEPAGSRTPGSALHVCTSRAHSMHNLAMEGFESTSPGGPGTFSRGSMHRASAERGEEHSHDNAISTMSLRTDMPVDLDRLKAWVDHLLWDREARPDEVYRMKGLLSVAGSDKKHMLQAVYELYEVTSGPEWQPDEKRCTRVVLIGRNLRKHVISSSWTRFLTGQVTEGHPMSSAGAVPTQALLHSGDKPGAAATQHGQQ